MGKPLLALAACVLALSACGAAPEQPADPAPSGPNSSAPAASEASAPSSAPEAEPVVFTVADGSRTTGPDTVEVGVGDRVLLEVTSDVADEVHVHGYDETVGVTPGTPARIEFVAELPGSFEVEMHEQGLLLTQLRVGG